MDSQERQLREKDCEIEELRALVAALTKRVAELELALAKAKKDSSTSSKPPSSKPPSSKPPSSDIAKPKPKQRPGRPKKQRRGGQPGHQRQLHQPLPPQRVDETINYEIEDFEAKRLGLAPTGDVDVKALGAKQANAITSGCGPQLLPARNKTATSSRFFSPPSAANSTTNPLRVCYIPNMAETPCGLIRPRRAAAHVVRHQLDRYHDGLLPPRVARRSLRSHRSTLGCHGVAALRPMRRYPNTATRSYPVHRVNPVNFSWNP